MNADVCELLVGIQNGPLRLVSQMESLVIAQKALLLAQEQSERQIDILTKELRRSRQAADLATAVTGPASGLDAGSRLTNTFELLEMLLIELPNDAVLIALCVKRQAKFLIAKCHQLQHKLFFEDDPLSSPPADIILNLVLKKESVLYCLPIYCDKQNFSLAYCYKPGRRRLFCQSMKLSKDQDTGQARIDLDFAESGLDVICRRLPEREGVGSWKRMYITQPFCDVILHATIKRGNRHTDPTNSGTLTGERTLDALLEGLAQARYIAE
ncbi:hypothetical protein LTR56_026285 [Elasticomyces elasticus]|nr:hypothetical protein LTR56_026285 [Elasticomyces elasticus]KAK3618284.1 hypothetical protein LTR22_026424 [Elasticomyces elasticus]KAK4903615.1 hypothetical protein LTR49_026776 [Elasticomyces elasticus]